MTPMTSRVANAEEDGFIFRSGRGKGFFAPGIPINGIIGMLL